MGLLKVSLSVQQVKMLEGKVCPYCKQGTVYVDSKEVYPKSYGMIYLCRPCNAWVGVHKNTDESLGRVANKELREAKKEAHKHFDKLWSTGNMTRNEAYRKLSEYLKLPKEYTHIGMFKLSTCYRVIEWSKGVIII